MDVRIGVTQVATGAARRAGRRHRPRRAEGRRSTRRCPAPTDVLWLTDRRGREVGVPVGEDRLRRDRRGRRRAPDRLRRLDRGRSGAAPTDLLDRRLLFVTGKGGVGKSTIAAALALLAARRRASGCSSARSTPRARWPRPSRPARCGSSPRQVARRASPRWRWTPRSRCSEYLRLQLQRPAAGPHRPAGPHVRLRRQRRARREGDPHRRQALLRGPGAPLRPRRRRRRRHRPHRRPARRARGDPRAGAGRPGPRPDRAG